MYLVMMHIVMRLWPYEAALAHDDARRGEVLHPVAPLYLTHPHLSLHFAVFHNTAIIYNRYFLSIRLDGSRFLYSLAIPTYVFF